MSSSVTSFILVIISIYLILQEDFLVEKVPFTLFYYSKLLLKALALRSQFGRENPVSDFGFLWLVCFGKKIIIDFTFYQIAWIKLLKLSLVLLGIDIGLAVISIKGISADSIIKVKPIKTLLMLMAGLADAISLENLVWRNHIDNWRADIVIFMFAVLDPLLYTGFCYFFRKQKFEKNFPNCQKNLNFAVFITTAHYLFSLDGYALLIALRRQIAFSSANVMSSNVGIRLLNCVTYISYTTYSILAQPPKKKRVSPSPVRPPMKRAMTGLPFSPPPRRLSSPISSECTSRDSFSVSPMVKESSTTLRKFQSMHESDTKFDQFLKPIAMRKL